MAKDDAILEEIRDRHQYASTEWQAIRDEASTDMRYVAGDPWDEKDRRARLAAGRPCLSLDELGQYLNQVVNDVRANPRGMKFAPTGNGANDAGAEFYQNKAREIEYRSHAQIAYTTAFENAASRSYGWCRVSTKFESDRSFDKDVSIDAIMDPDSVLPDTDFILPDGSDLKYLFVREQRTHKEFTREFPGAKVTSFGPDAMAVASQWVKADKIQIAEYWTKEATARKLLLVGLKGQPQPQPMFLDELPGGTLPRGAEVLRERTVDTAKIVQYLTNGIEILKKTAWPGKYIPFASCLGKVLYVDRGAGSKREILSLTRLARDPYMLYCYYRTCEAELVGMTPKFPYFVYEGQLSPEELVNLQKSLHEPIAVIQVKPVLDQTNGQVLGMPQRQPYEPPIQGLEAGAEAARRAIQAAMGISPLPTDAQRHNQKSGVALQQIESSGQRGSFHFVDHYDDMIRHVGVIVEDLLDKVLDTARDTGIRKPDDSAAIVRINDPGATDKDGKPAPISTKGDYLVTISTGPAYDSQRAAASDFAESLMQTPMAPQVADLIVKLKQLGPIGDQIADRLTPPQYKQQGKDDPQQTQQQLQHASQMLDVFTKELNAKNHIIETDQVKMQGQIQLKQMDIDFQMLKMQRDSETKITVAELGAKVDRMQLFMDERARLGVEEQAAHDRAHDVGMAAMAHTQALQQGQQAAQQGQDQSAQDHQEALDQGQQSADNTLAAQQQQAAVQPADAGAGA